MARIRTIKPEFWSDDRLTECSMSARLLFIGTWNFADDAGNLDRSAKQIKARVFPIDKVNCEPLLQELLRVGLLIEYSVSDKKYLHIQNFHKHQVINRPSKPTCPPLDGSLITPAPLNEDSGLKGREGKGVEVKYKTGLPEQFQISVSVAKWAKEKGHKNLEAHLESFISSVRKHGYKYIDWDAAFMDAVRQDWARLKSASAGKDSAALSWWLSAPGIEAKGAELLIPRGDDAFPHFKARVFEAAGAGPWNEAKTAAHVVAEAHRRAAA